MNIVAIVQARTGSTRLPGKVLADIAGKPLLAHVFERISCSRHCNKTVLATTQETEDDCLILLAEQHQVPVFRGSSHDVLGRYYNAAKEHEADIIVRVTADDPFKDPLLADRIINVFLKGGYDYVSNTLIPTYPEGLDIEVLSFEALMKAHNGASKPFEREHVTAYIWGNPDRFALKNVVNEKDLSFMRWTVDTAEDLIFVRAVYERIYHPGSIFIMDDVLNLFEVEPKILQLMPKIPRNFGLFLSKGESNETAR